MTGVQIQRADAHPAHHNLSRLSLLIGRALVLFTALLLAFMPLTEHLWTFDEFFRSGQDLEFGLLALATILCLVLVVSQHRKQVVNVLLSVWRWTVSSRCGVVPLLYGVLDRLALFRASTRSDYPRSTYSLPLQI